MEREPNVVAVTGVSGVGKDFLIGEALRDLEGAHVYSTNRELARLLSERGIVMSDLETSDEIEVNARESDRRVHERIRAMPDDRHVLNTHMVHERPEGAVVDTGTLEQIPPRDIVVVTASPEEISERRRDDRSRARVVEPDFAISEKQELELQGAKETARKIGARVTTLMNDAQHTDENIRKMRGLIETSVVDEEVENLTRSDLVARLLEEPDSRISLAEYEFGELEGYEEDLLRGVALSDSEVNVANQVYNRLLTNRGFSEEFYLSFQDDDECRQVFEEHLLGNASEREIHILYTCNEMAMEIAKLMKVALGKAGYLESHAERGVQSVPHTTYVLGLRDSSGRVAEYVFDPFADFSSSDTLVRQSGGVVDIRNNLDANRRLIGDEVEKMLMECENYEKVLDLIKATAEAGEYQPVELTSFVKNVVRAYERRSGGRVTYDRFSLNENRHIACVVQFLDECPGKGFLISHGFVGEFANAELKELELSGTLSHISLVRHAFFSEEDAHGIMGERS